MAFGVNTKLENPTQALKDLQDEFARRYGKPTFKPGTTVKLKDRPPHVTPDLLIGDIGVVISCDATNSTANVLGIHATGVTAVAQLPTTSLEEYDQSKK
jgi:hypothetical protein